MAFDSINYLAVLVAAVASCAFGAVWYMALAKPWMAAIGKTKDELAPNPIPFVIAAVAQLLMAFILAAIIGSVAARTAGAGITVANSLLAGAIVWAGFVATTLVVNHSYQGARPNLTAIDGAHWLGVLLIQGLVIGLFGA